MVYHLKLTYKKLVSHFSLSFVPFYQSISCFSPIVVFLFYWLSLSCNVQESELGVAPLGNMLVQKRCVAVFSSAASLHTPRLLLTLTPLSFPAVRAHHTALGQHDNWGHFFVSRWLCKSLQHVFQAGACGIHHSATSQLLLELSAVPIIAWHRHPYLFSWKFIIYDTSSFLPPGTWMLLSS